MGLGDSLKVIGAGAAWRTLGLPGAGYALLEAFSGGDEQERALAGISIVKAGDRSIDLIDEARRTERLTPDVVRLLADIGGSRARAVLTDIAGEGGPNAAAATESLALLEQWETDS